MIDEAHERTLHMDVLLGLITDMPCRRTTVQDCQNNMTQSDTPPALLYC